MIATRRRRGRFPWTTQAGSHCREKEMDMSNRELIDLLEKFRRGEGRSMAVAGKIEIALDELFGEEEPFSALSLALASYRPGGGPYLYNEEQLLPMVASIIDLVKSSDIAKS
jgi:hypothetical protein